MARPKMLILRGNDAPAGNYPDEQGNTPAWPRGALHETAAKDYATHRGYDGVVIDQPGKPQNQKSPQAEATVTEFLKDQDVSAFYGFSGGGYQIWHILSRLAAENTDTLHRIDLIVVLGVEKRIRDKPAYEALPFNTIAKKIVGSANWVDAKWEVVYGTNPSEKWKLPQGVPAGTDKHMFCPEWLLAGMP
jgi:hypothetical protein